MAFKTGDILGGNNPTISPKLGLKILQICTPDYYVLGSGGFIYVKIWDLVKNRAKMKISDLEIFQGDGFS